MLKSLRNGYNLKLLYLENNLRYKRAHTNKYVFIVVLFVASQVKYLMKDYLNNVL